MYWTSKEQTALETWYYCSSATSATTRNYLYNVTLYPAFSNLIDKLISTFGGIENDEEDIKQDLHILIWSKLLHKLKPEYMKASNQYIYICCWNYVYTNHINNKKLNTIDVTAYNDESDDYVYSYVPATDDYNADYNATKKDNQLLIIDAIDEKISNIKAYTVQTMYLDYLKRYLIVNDFNAEGFDKYVQKEMNISKENFTLINSKLKINTKELRLQKIKKQYK